MIENRYSKYYKVENGNFKLIYELESPEDIKQILIEASKNHNISTLSLSNVVFKKTMYLTDFLRKNTTVISLDFYNCKIGLNGLKYVLDALRENTTVKSLQLGENMIGPKGVMCIVDFLQVNNTVTKLDIRDNLIGLKGGEYLSEELKVNTSITTLVLGDNYKADRIERLRKEHGYDVLSKGNDIADKIDEANKGYECIAKGLKVNNTITNLVVFTGLKHMIDVLKTNTSITKIQIPTGIQIQEVLILANALKVNKTLTSIIFIGYSNGKLEWWNSLMDALKTNKTLTSVEFEGCDYLRETVIKDFLDALKVNISIISADTIVKILKDYPYKFSHDDRVSFYKELKKQLFFNNFYKCIKDYVFGTNEPKFSEHGELHALESILKNVKGGYKDSESYKKVDDHEKIDALFNSKRIKFTLDSFDKLKIGQRFNYSKLKFFRKLFEKSVDKNIADETDIKISKFEELSQKLSKAWFTKVFSKYVQKEILDFLTFEDVYKIFKIKDRNVKLDMQDIQGEDIQQNIDIKYSGGSGDIHDVD